MGTGTLIGKKHVLTRASNLYDRDDGGQASEVYFEGALNGDQAPYPRVKARRLFYPDGHKEVGFEARWDLDYGLVELDSRFDLATLPALVAKADNELVGQTVTIHGYPGDRFYPEDQMFKGSGKIGAVTATELQYPVTWPGDMPKGFGGASLMMGDASQIVGIHTHSGFDFAGARRLTPDVIAQICHWIAGDAPAAAQLL
jgi:glutamyl endopeptidase